MPKWEKTVLNTAPDNGIKLLLRNVWKTLPYCFNETVALSDSHKPNESGGEHEDDWVVIYHGAVGANARPEWRGAKGVKMRTGRAIPRPL